MIYDPFEVVTDGQITAPHITHHFLRVLYSLAVYSICRSLFHIPPVFAMVIASPLFVSFRIWLEWTKPSMPKPHSWKLFFDDMMIAFCCSLPAVVLAFTEMCLWFAAGAMWMVAVTGYFLCRANARP